MIEVPNTAEVVATFAVVALVVGVVLVEMPTLATRKLQIESERIRGAVLDAYLDGKMRRDAPGLNAFLQFCHIVEWHTPDLRLGRVLSLKLALRLHPSALSTDNAIRNTDPILEQYEHELDELVGDYLINGSRVWWVLRPLRSLLRGVRRLFPHETPHEVSAFQLAVGLREEVGDNSAGSAAVRTMLTGVDPHRPDRVLQPV